MSNWCRTGRIALCVAAAHLVAGCEGIAPRPEPIAMDVENGRAGAATGFAVRNIGSQVAFVSSCGDHVLPAIERRVGNDWVNAGAALCVAIYSTVPIPVDVGGVLRENMTIPVAGTYRLRVAVQVGSRSAEPESVVSPSFVIE